MQVENVAEFLEGLRALTGAVGSDFHDRVPSAKSERILDTPKTAVFQNLFKPDPPSVHDAMPIRSLLYNNSFG
jgi:hypothetical protein